MIEIFYKCRAILAILLLLFAAPVYTAFDCRLGENDSSIILSRQNEAGKGKGIVWTRTLGRGEYVSDLKLDSAGNIYITGDYFWTNPLLNPVEFHKPGIRDSDRDVFIKKITPEGILEWDKNAGGLVV